jgi:uncharacterized membrane protein
MYSLHVLTLFLGLIANFDSSAKAVERIQVSTNQRVDFVQYKDCEFRITIIYKPCNLMVLDS